MKCPNLSPKKNQEIVSNLNKYLPTNKVAFKCLNGYQMDGPSTVTCGRNGEWQGNAPSCQPKTCSELPLLVRFILKFIFIIYILFMIIKLSKRFNSNIMLFL